MENSENGECRMKKKMDLAAEIDLTQDSVVQLTSWCGQIALHELWGLGRTRLDRLTRREQQLKIVGDRAATMAWQLMALACVQELGFGADRLNRLYAEMRRNYEQLNEWGKEDGVDVAMEKLRRCACDALQTEEIVVENIDDEKTVQALSQSYKKQEDEFIKRAVMMAAGRRAGKQGAARLPLSGDEVQRKIEAAKAQMSLGAFRRRV